MRSRGVDLCRKHVSAGAYGLYELWILRIYFNFSAQTANLNVDAAIKSAGYASSRQIEQLITG